jgi:hypothetical protein
MVTMDRVERQGTAGSAMLDVVMGCTVLTIAVLGALSVIPGAAQMQNGLCEREEAQLVLQRIAEEVFRESPTEAFVEFNSSGMDDFDGPDTGHGPEFDLQGSIPTSNGSALGRVILPHYTINGFGEARIFEDTIDPLLGMPCDLDGDGVVSTGGVPPEDLLILPVRLVIEWEGVGGRQHIETRFILGNR